MSNLDHILAAKRSDLVDRKRKTPLEALRALASMQSRPLPFLNTVSDDRPLRLVGLIRYRPPDETAAGEVYDPVAQAVRYAQAGADAIALFTDSSIYGGGLDDLTFVARALRAYDVPVLSMDYLFDEYQVVEARAAGASAILLSVGLLDRSLLRNLMSAVQRNRMTAVLRADTRDQLRTALDLSPQAVALPCLRLPDGQPDVDQLTSLLEFIPTPVNTLLFDDLLSPAELALLARLDIDAVLTGLTSAGAIRHVIEILQAPPAPRED